MPYDKRFHMNEGNHAVEQNAEKCEPCPEINAAPDAAQEQGPDQASPAVDAQQPAEDEQQTVMDVQPTSSENQGNEPEKSETKASPGKRSNRSKGQKRTKPIGSAKCDSDASTPPHVPASDIWTFGMQTPAEEPKPKFVYPMTDLGNAQMFFRLFNKSFLYDQERGQWIGWDVDRKRWLTGKLAYKVMMRLIKKLVTELYRQAKSRHPLRTRNGETVTPEEALGWAKSTSQKGRQKAMLDLVRDLPGVRVSKAELDRDPYLLGVTNGVLDLRTGTLIENRPDLRITRYANAAYHKDADAPIFRRFMDEICLGRQDLVDFIQEVLGYSLSGLVTEHAFFLLVGTGANGKSTLVEAFLYLLGEYGIGMPSHAFLKSNSRAIRNDMARLPGVRFAPCAEVNTGMSLDESMVKRATGGDIMTARFIGKEYFDFHPSAKFFLSVNTLPKITGADNGIYRRLVVIPFEGNFEATMDGDLPKKLKDKIDGILAWAVQGFLRWQEREKLVKPQCVVDACAAYRAEMDTVQSFLDECCILDPSASTPLGVLYDAYQLWAKGAVVDSAKMHLFGTLMGQKGFKKKKSGSWRWEGVGLKSAVTANTSSVFGQAAPDSQAEATERPQ